MMLVTGLLGVLMDIASDPDMFSDEANTFKCIAYGVDVLTLLSYFAVVLSQRMEIDDDIGT